MVSTGLPSGTVYPTLQLLEDQGYVRAVDADGKKVYHITDEGIAFLEEHKDLVTEILHTLGRLLVGEFRHRWTDVIP